MEIPDGKQVGYGSLGIDQREDQRRSRPFRGKGFIRNAFRGKPLQRVAGQQRGRDRTGFPDRLHGRLRRSDNPALAGDSGRVLEDVREGILIN